MTAILKNRSSRSKDSFRKVRN